MKNVESVISAGVARTMQCKLIKQFTETMLNVPLRPGIFGSKVCPGGDLVYTYNVGDIVKGIDSEKGYLTVQSVDGCFPINIPYEYLSKNETVKSVQNVAVANPDKVVGVNVSGYKYSTTFLALTLAGTLLGVGVAWKFKQNWIGYVALITGGFLGGASVGLKVSTPIKETRN